MVLFLRRQIKDLFWAVNLLQLSFSSILHTSPKHRLHPRKSTLLCTQMWHIFAVPAGTYWTEREQGSKGNQPGEHLQWKWLWMVSSIVLTDRKDRSVMPHTHTCTHTRLHLFMHILWLLLYCTYRQPEAVNNRWTERMVHLLAPLKWF